MSIKYSILLFKYRHQNTAYVKYQLVGRGYNQVKMLCKIKVFKPVTFIRQKPSSTWWKGINSHPIIYWNVQNLFLIKFHILFYLLYLSNFFIYWMTFQKSLFGRNHERQRGDQNLFSRPSYPSYFLRHPRSLSKR